MGQQSRREREEGLLGAVEDIATNVGRIGYGLMHLPLRLLPPQTRSHMENVLRELSYSFVSLPRDFAEIASASVEEWVGDDSASKRPSAGPGMPSRGVEVRSTPAERDLGPAQQIGLIRLPIQPPMAPPGGGVELFSAGAPPLASAVPDGLSIAHIEYDPPGDDVQGEYVLISNSSDQPVELTGWTLHDGELKHVYTFPSFLLAAGASVRVWTRRGGDDAGNLHWQSSRPIWNNRGDTGTLRLPGGEVVSSYTYSGS